MKNSSALRSSVSRLAISVLAVLLLPACGQAEQANTAPDESTAPIQVAEARPAQVAQAQPATQPSGRGSGTSAQSVGEPGRVAGKPNPLKNVYFGEQHMHTRNSFDAFTAGVSATWDDAYNFAKGQEVKLSTTGEPMKRRTPYDFVAITDHS